MKIFVLPISGGGFPVQLAMLKDINIKPDVMMTASGGNVASYLYLASFNYSMNDIINYINRDMFIRGNKFSAFFRNGFLPGVGIDKLFDKFFTKESIQSVEIFTLTFNKSGCCACIFSNKSKQDSLIQELTTMDKIMYQNTLEHVDGDINEISKVSLASASIPDIAQPQNINGNLYQDGGVCYTSSVIPLSLHIQDMCNSHDGLCQITYFGSYEMEKIEQVLDSAPNKSFRRIYQKIHYSLLEERSLLIHIFNKFVKKFKVINILNIDRTKTFEILNKQKDKNYLLMLYPNGILDINIIDFTPDEILHVIEKVIYSGFLFIEQE